MTHNTVGNNALSSPGLDINGNPFPLNSITLSFEKEDAWYMLSIPVDMTRKDFLDNNIHIQGFGNDGADRNLFSGYEGKWLPDIDDNSFAFEPINAGSPFIIYIFHESNLVLPLPDSITFSGEEPISNPTIDLNTIEDKWTLIGNPFFSRIDISNIGSWTNGGELEINNGWVWNPKINQYISSILLNNTINMGEAFFVLNKNAMSITIPYSSRISSPSNSKGKQKYASDTLTFVNNCGLRFQPFCLAPLWNFGRIDAREENNNVVTCDHFERNTVVASNIFFSYDESDDDNGLFSPPGLSGTPEVCKDLFKIRYVINGITYRALLVPYLDRPLELPILIDKPYTGAGDGIFYIGSKDTISPYNPNHTFSLDGDIIVPDSWELLLVDHKNNDRVHNLKEAWYRLVLPEDSVSEIFFTLKINPNSQSNPEFSGIELNYQFDFQNTGWHILSASNREHFLHDFTEDRHVQGYNGFFPNSGISLYLSYDGINWTYNKETKNLPTYIKPGTGFLYHNFHSGNGNSWVMSGIETPSDVKVDLHSNGNGWNLLGNPYRTNLDVSNIESWVEGGSLESTIAWYYDSNLKQYIPSIIAGNRIAPSNGFFLKNTDATSLTIPVSAKESSTKSSTVAKGPSSTLFSFVLKNNPDSGKHIISNTAGIWFHEKATTEKDNFDGELPLALPQYEVGGVSSYYSQIELELDDNRYGIISLPLFQEKETKTILKVVISHQNLKGIFTLDWSKLVSLLDDHLSLVLEDKEKKSFIDMKQIHVYSFDINDLNKEEYKERFYIHIGQKGIENPANNGASTLPQSFSVSQNYPNPFNPITTINIDLPENSHLKVVIYSVLGQEIAQLVDSFTEAGSYQYTWDAYRYSSGIYIYRVEAGFNYEYTGTMTLLK